MYLLFSNMFCQVEHNLLGNALPVIVADREICAELRTLERELDQASDRQSSDMDGFSSDETRKNREAEATDFLHELGWVFQSTAMGLSPMDDANVDRHIRDMEVYRFKKLLTYGVVHDWCAVVRKLLDLLFGIGTDRLEEVLGMLSEVNLVHKAVKRKSKAMVQLLMYYVPDRYGARSMKNIFTPTMRGPAGFTPLHVAACTSGAEDVLDALTNDPHEVPYERNLGKTLKHFLPECSANVCKFSRHLGSSSEEQFYVLFSQACPGSLYVFFVVMCRLAFGDGILCAISKVSHPNGMLRSGGTFPT